MDDRPLRFYADEDFSPNLIALLRGCGGDVLTVQEDGRSGAADRQVMDRATELGRLLLSHDHHMLAEAHEREDRGAGFSGLLRVKQARRFDPDVRASLRLIAEAGRPDDFADRVTYLPL